MKPAVAGHPCCLKKIFPHSAYSFQRNSTSGVNFIGTRLERECAEDVRGRECGAKMTASCCRPDAELRSRCFQGQLHGGTLFGDLVCVPATTGGDLPLYSVYVAE